MCANINIMVMFYAFFRQEAAHLLLNIIKVIHILISACHPDCILLQIFCR